MRILSLQQLFSSRSTSSVIETQTLLQHSTTSDEQAMVSLLDYIRHPEFKRLLNQILSAQAKNNLNAIAVVSEFPGEGKTFLVGALALAYAKFLDSRVLIVDTLRQPRKGKLYYECLAGQNKRCDFDNERNTRGSIDFISAEEAEAKSGNGYDFHLGRYIQLLKKQYDVILFDTCALRSVNSTNMDPLILGQYVDFSLLVTSSRSMKSDIMKSVVRQFEKHNIQLMGSVYNPGAPL